MSTSGSQSLDETAQADRRAGLAHLDDVHAEAELLIARHRAVEAHSAPHPPAYAPHDRRCLRMNAGSLTSSKIKRLSAVVAWRRISRSVSSTSVIQISVCAWTIRLTLRCRSPSHRSSKRRKACRDRCGPPGGSGASSFSSRRRRSARWVRRSQPLPQAVRAYRKHAGARRVRLPRQGPSAVPVVEGEQQLGCAIQLGGAQTAESEQGRVISADADPQESALEEIALADSQRVERWSGVMIQVVPQVAAHTGLLPQCQRRVAMRGRERTQHQPGRAEIQA